MSMEFSVKNPYIQDFSNARFVSGTFDINLICEIYYISHYALKNVCRNED